MEKTEDLLESLGYVEFVLEKWQIKGKSQELKRVVGKYNIMDPLADMLTTINNAQIVSKKQISVPYSEFKFRILEVFKKEGYILDVQKKGRVPNKRIVIDLKYKEDGTSMILKIKKVSKQGQRIYTSFSEIKPVKSGYGTSFISTSKGILTDKEARMKKVGGEIICEIW